MARGSIVWRCSVCGTKTKACQHSGRGYAIVYPVHRWDPGKGRVIKTQKWEAVPLNKKHKPVKKLAEDLLAERLHTLSNRTYRELPDIAFCDFADKWLAGYVRCAVKVSTYNAYVCHVRVHFKPALGPLALKAIWEDTIQGYISSTLAAGAKPTSVKNHLVVPKEMLRHAVKWGFLAVNPAAEVKAPGWNGRRWISSRRRRWPTCSRPGTRRTASRRSSRTDPFPSSWPSFPDAGRASNSRSASATWVSGRAKCGSGRNCSGSGNGTRLVSRAGISRRPKPRPRFGTSTFRRTSWGICEGISRDCVTRTAICCSSRRATAPLDPKNIGDRVFRKALERAELRRIRWYDLRHTYARLQLAAGANIKYLSQQMGHASAQITLDPYSHLMKDSHPAQARLSSLIFDAPPRANVVLTEHPRAPKKTVKDGERCIAATTA